jgi:hypothetical protein
MRIHTFRQNVNLLVELTVSNAVQAMHIFGMGAEEQIADAPKTPDKDSGGNNRMIRC